MLLQVKKFYQKILQKWQPENQFHALVCLQRVKRNFYWKMKFLKQATYIRYETAKLSKFVQNSMVTSTESFLAEDSLKTIKGLELVFRPYFSYNFLTRKIYFLILHTLAKFHYQTVYFPSYSIICVSCFMLGHLMTS